MTLLSFVATQQKPLNLRERERERESEDMKRSCCSKTTAKKKNSKEEKEESREWTEGRCWMLDDEFGK